MSKQEFQFITCASCGFEFAVPESFLVRRRQDGCLFYCPSSGGNDRWNVHSMSYEKPIPPKPIIKEVIKEIPKNSMKHLDLFSGIGGFALATEMVWDDVEHIFCDNDLFSQEILKKHWPNSLIYGDIKELTAKRIIADTHSSRLQGSTKTRGDAKDRQKSDDKRSRISIDILTGGFPCQPFSAAGRRRGTEDDRHLWPEMLRVIRETNPRWVIGENVGGLLTWNEGMVFEQVCLDLEAEGYEVQAFVIPACGVNAPHRRDRIWIVGHTKYDGRNGTEDGESDIERSYSNTKRSHKLRKLERTNSIREVTTYPTNLDEKRRNSGPREKQFRRSDWTKDWTQIATTFCRVDDGIPRRLDRNPRLKALGNAIVPQVAAEVMFAISTGGL